MHHPNLTLIRNFYQAFRQKDANNMINCYHDEIKFKDPAFGKLSGDSAKAMWAMLIERSQDLEVNLIEARADENSGTAVWEAKYLFSKTNRKIHNIIRASFRFKDGKIIQHDDRFNLWKWAFMALGVPGLLIGWSGFFRKKLNGQTNRMLVKYMAD